MATSSRFCSDEELQKARDDLRELLARRGVGDESKAPSHVEEGSKEEGMEKKDKVGKKKKMYVLPKEQVNAILNFQCGRFYDSKPVRKLAHEDEEMYGDRRTLIAVAGVLTKHYDDIIRAAQDKMRHEIETKGYFAYEATDDEVESDNESARMESDNESAKMESDSESARMGPRGKGRRRHRPGIVKHAGGVKRLN